MAATRDTAERREKALALEQIVMGDLPIAPLPVQTGIWAHWSYVMDWPVTITFYTNRKGEEVWRSDA